MIESLFDFKIRKTKLNLIFQLQMTLYAHIFAHCAKEAV